MASATRLTAVAAALTSFLFIGASAQGPLDDPGVQTRPSETFSQRILAGGLQDPWELLWGPDGRLWATERSGQRIVRVDPVNGSRTTLLTIADSFRDAGGQEGVLGMALHPGLLKARGQDYLYVAFVYDADPGQAVNRRLKLRRYTLDPATNTLGSPVDLLSDLPSNDDHLGGRLAFGPDQKLYLTIGDLAANHLWNACHLNHAQDLPSAADVHARSWSAYQGKILRINLDGSIPPDNPVIGGVRSHVYSYGHRNPQGLVFGPDGKLYSSEHGPSTDDELNLIAAGKNYGWPYVAGYRDDRGYVYANWSASAPAPCASLRFDPLVAPSSVPQQKESAWNHPDFTPPLRTFFTVDGSYRFKEFGNATIAPSGLDFFSAGGIPGWANSILMASLTRGSIFRVKLGADGRSATGPTIQYFSSKDRYRDVAVSPDGRTIYVAVDTAGSADHPGAILAFTYSPR